MPNHLFDSLIPAGRAPGQICLEAADRRRFTYGDLDRRSASYAQALTRCGVRKGDRVALQAEKSPEALFLYLGCIRAGAAFLPLNTAYTRAEIEYFVGDAEPALFVGPPEQWAELHAILQSASGGRVETLGPDGRGSVADLAEAETGEWTDVECGPGDLAAILYTSGTTGRSKGAMLSHGNLRANAEALVETWRFTADRHGAIPTAPNWSNHDVLRLLSTAARD